MALLLPSNLTGISLTGRGTTVEPMYWSGSFSTDMFYKFIFADSGDIELPRPQDVAVSMGTTYSELVGVWFIIFNDTINTTISVTNEGGIASPGNQVLYPEATMIVSATSNSINTWRMLGGV